MKIAIRCLIVLLCAARAEARTEEAVPLSADAEAKMSVGSCFDDIALTGYAPIDVTINNHSGQTRKWAIEFASPAYAYGYMNTVRSTFTVSVEDNGTRTIPFMVPTSDVGNGQIPLQVSVSGYGAEALIEQAIGSRSWNGKPVTPFIAISESLGTRIWSDMSKRLESDNKDLVGSTVNPDDLPEDWRGLSGVAALWLSNDELNRLAPAQRDAIVTWVHTGGQLMVCGTNTVPVDFQYGGFGQVTALPGGLDEEKTIATIEGLPAHDSKFDAFSTPERTALAAVQPNVPLLGTFMAVFAVVVGPFNVYGLARRRRERLFWTTPLISLGASGLLMGMIVMQDGAGGHGLRSAVVCIFPRSHNEVVVQEQLSRTGLLLDSAFQTRDPSCIEQLQIQPYKDAAYGAVTPGRELRNDGTAYSKNWFASRAAQAQRIVTVTPTRAEITILNAGDAAHGAAPVIVSSFETTLDTLSYRGTDNRVWQGKNVRTGEKQTLEPAPATSPSSPATAGLHGFDQQPGYFWAIAGHSRDLVNTLGAIRWTDQPVAYAGPVSP